MSVPSKTQSDQRIAGIDAMRVLANFSVTISHWFSWYGPHGGLVYLTLYYTLGGLVYFAVPFFFIVSGYFIRHSLGRGKKGREVFLNYSRRVVPIFLFWALVYAVVPYIGLRTILYRDFAQLLEHWRAIGEVFRKDPTYIVLTGHTDHLWFLTSLMIGCLWLTVCNRLRKESWVPLFGIAAYSVLVMTQSYAPYLGIKSGPWNLTRGLLAPISFMSLGYYVRWKDLRVSSWTAVLIVAAGLMFKLSERFVFDGFHSDPMRHPFTLATPVIGLGMFMLALSSPRILSSGVFKHFARLTLGIYACHLMIDHKVHALDIFRHGTWFEFLGPPVVYALTLILVILLSRIPVMKRFVLNY